MGITVCRVLVIEKNRHIRSFLQRELLREGHRVQTISDIGERIDIDCDIVIVDSELLHGRLWNSFETLRSHNPHMIVILHSVDLTSDTSRVTIPPDWSDRVTIVEKGNIMALREIILSHAACCCKHEEKG